MLADALLVEGYKAAAYITVIAEAKPNLEEKKYLDDIVFQLSDL